ncbi:MAG TPA: hypothetical protein VLH10_15250 [Yinghuangia sp.]|uniref:hypothetical protein n=1 Tax=Yinghuangia sp. YIM S10712 TaxID=3436930 RepID=UPI002CA540C9|nr:hypothetical protein [Yinghuangia sp.]
MNKTAKAAAIVALGAALATAAPTAAHAAGGGAGTVTVERGHALSCSGAAEGVSAYVELYENSAYGAHANVVVETPSGEYGGGFGPETTSLFKRGSVQADVEIGPLGEEPAGDRYTLVVEGTYERAGRPERVDEVIEDAGQRIVTKGRKSPLAAQVSVTVLGKTVPLSCDTAFAFDLVVRRTSL